MYRDNVDISDRDADGPRGKRLFAAIMSLAWRGIGRVWAFRQGWITGSPLSDNRPGGEREQRSVSLPEAELTESQRKEAAEELRRKPHIG